MIRRNFLRHLTATVAGLLIADDALEMLVEPRRKVWPGWSAPTTPVAVGSWTAVQISTGWTVRADGSYGLPVYSHQVDGGQWRPGLPAGIEIVGNPSPPPVFWS